MHKSTDIMSDALDRVRSEAPAMTAHCAITVDNLWDGVSDGNDGCWAIKARDEWHHPR
jgi:hypothetical protein